MIDLSTEGLTSLERRLSATFSDFQARLASARRALASGNRRYAECPPAWALHRLQLAFATEDETVQIGADDTVAIGCLMTLVQTIDRWEAHPDFAQMHAEILNDYHHAMTLLIGAAYLIEVGNRVQLLTPSGQQGRTPDMVFLDREGNRRPGEVKAPRQLRWLKAIPSHAVLVRAIESCVKASKGQLIDGAGGVLTIGSSIDSMDVREPVVAAIRGARLPPRIAAVAFVNVVQTPEIFISDGQLQVTATSQVFALRNPASPAASEIWTGEPVA